MGTTKTASKVTKAAPAAATGGEPTLPQLRFRKLVRALHKHGTGESAVALGARFGADPALIAKIIVGEDGAHADPATIERAAKETGVHSDFFTQEDLGEHTTHEHFVGSSPLGKTAAVPSSEG